MVGVLAQRSETTTVNVHIVAMSYCGQQLRNLRYQSCRSKLVYASVSICG